VAISILINVLAINIAFISLVVWLKYI
jgi:hypothetical protein